MHVVRVLRQRNSCCTGGAGVTTEDLLLVLQVVRAYECKNRERAVVLSRFYRCYDRGCVVYFAGCTGITTKDVCVVQVLQVSGQKTCCCRGFLVVTQEDVLLCSADCTGVMTRTCYVLCRL